MSALKRAFGHFARRASKATGHPVAFVLAVVLVVAWALSGPMFRFGETWQLVINTGTTIITFLMVFAVQNSQAHDSAALQMKLDELIYVTTKARNALVSSEELDEDDLLSLRLATIAPVEAGFLSREPATP